jgi:Uma2 family endonuclease
MFMPAATDNWTVAMLDALPDDGQRYEIIDGRLFVTPSPGEGHQDVVRDLVVRLTQYLSASDVATVMVSPSDIWREERARNRVQPDVYVVRRREGKRPEYPYHLRDLLLAVEVVSPGNPLLDYHIKRELYLSEGVPEYWVIDPEARIVHRWRSNDEPGETIHQTLRWKPAGMSEEFVLELPAFFDDAFR